MIRALKSPSVEKTDQEEQSASATSEERENRSEDEPGAQDDAYYRTRPEVCSSEGSPRSRSRSRSQSRSRSGSAASASGDDSRKSGSNDDEDGDEEEEDSCRSDEDDEDEGGDRDRDEKEEAEEGSKRDSQIPLVTDTQQPSRNGSVKSTAGGSIGTGGGGSGFDDSFERAFGPSKNETVSSGTSGWATFDADEEEKRVSPPQQAATATTYSRQSSTATFDSRTSQDSPRAQQQQQPHWSNSPRVNRVQHLSRRCSSSASRDSLAEGGENPFSQDAFTPPSHQQRQTTKQLSTSSNGAWEGDANGSSSASNEDAATDALSAFENACFRVHAKVFKEDGSGSGVGDEPGAGVPKSDSINIFSVKEDPFDDDIFK